MSVGTNNPFTPGMGRFPPFLAGRGRIRDKLVDGVNRVADTKPGNSIVLYGPRGNGKTVLLLETKALAKEKGVQVRRLTSEDFLVGLYGITTALSRDPDSGEDAASQAGFTGELAPKQVEHDRIAEALRHVARARPLVLLVDEAHVMPPELGRAILSALQDVIGDGFPVLAVLAGTPELPARFHEMQASFWERSDKLKIGRLESEEAVREALSIPSKESGLPMSKDALDLLVEESQRYPYFLQIVGEAAWSAAKVRKAKPTRITLADVRAGMIEAENARELFYEERRKEIATQGLLREAEAVSSAITESAGTDGVFPWQKLEEMLSAVCGSRVGPPPWEVQDRLDAMGLIWSLRVGEWEPGIPSLCAYMVRHTGRGRYENYQPLESPDDIPF